MKRLINKLWDHSLTQSVLRIHLISDSLGTKSGSVDHELFFKTVKTVFKLILIFFLPFFAFKDKEKNGNLFLLVEILGLRAKSFSGYFDPYIRIQKAIMLRIRILSTGLTITLSWFYKCS